MTRGRWEVSAAIAHDRVLGIVRGEDAASARSAADALFDAGLRAAEVSLSTPGALSAIASLAGAGHLAGAGTVLDAPSAYAALAHGARFLVCPVLAEDVVTVGHRHGAAVMAAASTPTEALRALELGADLVKLFPARTWTPSALEDLLQALPQLPLVPTGGIGVDDAREWIDAGAVAVGIGGALTAGGPARARERVVGLLEAIA